MIKARAIIGLNSSNPVTVNLKRDPEWEILQQNVMMSQVKGLYEVRSIQPPADNELVPVYVLMPM